MSENKTVNEALKIWNAAVDAVRPEVLFKGTVRDLLQSEIATARRVVVVGAGKAGAAMAEAFEATFPEFLDRIDGLVNVPANAVKHLKKIRLHAARPAGHNFPTIEGVNGAEEMLRLVNACGPDDIAICLVSGGGSALLPSPVEGVTLEDKQAITKLLHRCGATIHEMNAVRKHLSRIKGGRLAKAFRGRKLFSLIISDVVGDPLDVIASGPTAADPSTFADAIAIIDRFNLRDQAPKSILNYLESGNNGDIEETLKVLPDNVLNVMLGNNVLALCAASRQAEDLGYRVLNLGSYIEGESSQVAIATAGIVRSIRENLTPFQPPVCILIGGETTVNLGTNPGKGGRNQEFVLAMMNHLHRDGMQGVTVLSGGTDGEDGPTDAAGAFATEESFIAIEKHSLNITNCLNNHNAYPLFEAVKSLVRTGLTNTNVMDVRVILVN